MSRFKSFNPKKYSRTKTTNYKELTEYCSSCGYTYGKHCGDKCPTDDSIKLQKLYGAKVRRVKHELKSAGT